MVIMNWAWDKSCTSLVPNKTEMCDRVCTPVNRTLLQHPELEYIAMHEDEQVVTTTTMRTFNDGLEMVDPGTLNLSEGYAGTIVNHTDF
jgi:hypothetical protein